METICNPSCVSPTVTDLVRSIEISPSRLGLRNGEHRWASLPQGDRLVLALGQQAGGRDSPHAAGLRHRLSAHLAAPHDHASARGCS